MDWGDPSNDTYHYRYLVAVKYNVTKESNIVSVAMSTWRYTPPPDDDISEELIGVSELLKRTRLIVTFKGNDRLLLLYRK